MFLDCLWWWTIDSFLENSRWGWWTNPGEAGSQIHVFFFVGKGYTNWDTWMHPTFFLVLFSFCFLIPLYRLWWSKNWRSHREVSILTSTSTGSWQISQFHRKQRNEKQGFSTLLGDGKISLLSYLEAMIFSSHVAFHFGRRSSLWMLVMRDAFWVVVGSGFFIAVRWPQCWGGLPWRKYVADDSCGPEKCMVWKRRVHSDFSTLYIHL